MGALHLRRTYRGFVSTAAPNIATTDKHQDLKLQTAL
jgi:hypothetical protein